MNNICSIDSNYFNKFTHEIKNPLTVCNGYLDIILQSKDKDRETYLEIVKNEIRRTINIINNYNNLFNLNKTNFYLEDLMNEVSIIFNKIYNCKIIIVSQNQLKYYGDYNKLKQVFINLIKNSYEAKTNTKLIIVIKIKEYNDNYKISIIDNGIGMNKDTLNNIYKEYYTTKTNGNGLGIPYIMNIIKLHKGNLNYYSKEKLGTKVVITLPK
ncbi:MAG: HAMP domain-containing histidine kinase [Bacilli bacterium]|nr:HAMP domain-containing histidine kinase [Bacilli bacterium]